MDLDNLFWLIKKICLTKSFSLDEERRVLKSSNHECGYGCFLFSSCMDCIFSFLLFGLLFLLRGADSAIVLGPIEGELAKKQIPIDLGGPLKFWFL